MEMEMERWLEQKAPQDQRVLTRLLPCHCVLGCSRLVARLYPWFHALSNVVCFGYQLAYIYGKTDFFHPRLHLVGQVLKRLGLEDMKRQTQQQLIRNQQLMDRYPGNQIHQVLRRWFIFAVTRGLDYLKFLLPVSIFFLKFLQWWYTSPYYKNKNKSLPIPPPPKPLIPHPDAISLPANRALCPLCRQERSNATMTHTGYVFCYPCIYQYVTQQGRCPVTHKSTTSNQLRRLFIDS
eukprot:Lithocolla_globosa_v1_NODE_1667_length_2409_cov_9.852229.p1 type:complete len:236 gc:universal NODE_1667_length_2409_cov_9.852229:849-142(-)